MQAGAGLDRQAGSQNELRRVVVEVERHPDKLYPPVGSIVTNMTRPPERVTLCYNQRRAAEQHIATGLRNRWKSQPFRKLVSLVAQTVGRGTALTHCRTSDRTAITDR